MRSRRGARGWRRRSSGGGIVDQSDSSGRIGARTGPRLYLALLSLLSLAVPSATLACALGVACGFVAPRGAGWLYAAIFAASLAVALWPVVRGPQVFVFHHLGGMYPGPIYDEAIATSRALWLFRADTLLYAGACAGIALIAGPPRPRRRGILALIAAGTGALWMSLQADERHWKAGVAQRG